MLFRSDGFKVLVYEYFPTLFWLLSHPLKVLPFKAFTKICPHFLIGFIFLFSFNFLILFFHLIFIFFHLKFILI